MRTSLPQKSDDDGDDDNIVVMQTLWCSPSIKLKIHGCRGDTRYCNYLIEMNIV
jgi:hypothetical protein